MKTLAIITGVLLSGSIFSQDVINTTDGRSISAKVLEIGTSEVKYKSSSNQDGPVYVMNKTDVSSIKYENGTEDVFSQAGDGSNKINGYNTDPNGGAGTSSSNNTYASSGGYNNGSYSNNRGSNFGPLLLLAVGAAVYANRHHSGYYHNQYPHYSSHYCGTRSGYVHHR